MRVTYCANHIIARTTPATVIVTVDANEPIPLCPPCFEDFAYGRDHLVRIVQRLDGVCEHSRCYSCQSTPTCCRCQLPPIKREREIDRERLTRDWDARVNGL